MSQRGGKSIASGTYGCVFKPSLKCANGEKNIDGVSKIMTDEEAKKEFDEINKYKDILKKIPNYNDYFLFATSLCKPDELSNDDMEDIDSKCKRFTYLDKLKKELPKTTSFSIVNTSYGGMDMFNHYSNIILDYKSIYIYDNLLKNITLNAIIPMNKLKLIHGDIKSDNLLIDKSGNIRIIDWGMSIDFNKGLNSCHDELEWRPIAINCPPSSIVFSNFYLTKINYYLKSTLISQTKITKDSIYNLINNNYVEFEKNYGEGHRQQLISVLNIIKKYSSLDLPTADVMILNYITECVYSYVKYSKLFKTKNNINIYFDYTEYFNDIFSKNYDIYGIVMMYFFILQTLELDPSRVILKKEYDVNQVKKYLADFLYKNMLLNSTKLIDVNNVFKESKKILLFFQKGDPLMNLNKLSFSNKIENIISNTKSVTKDDLNKRMKEISKISTIGTNTLVKKSRKKSKKNRHKKSRRRRRLDNNIKRKNKL